MSYLRIVRIISLVSFLAFAGLLTARVAWNATVIPASTSLPVPLTPLPDFQATAATTDAVTPMKKSDLRGHVWVADFFFATCGNICPAMTRQMHRLQSRLPKEVWLVSFTVDPETDTPADLQGYARDNSADPGRWFFLRMEKQPLAKLMYFGFKSLASYQEPFDNHVILSHNSRFFLVDAQGRIRGSYEGLEKDSIEEVTQAVSALLKER